LQAPPRGPPRGGAGDGSAAIVNDWVYAVCMRTQALRITVGMYDNGDWHVTYIEDTYIRGVLVNSELLVGPIYCRWQDVEEVTRRQLRLLHSRELARLGVPAVG